jgi:hypothetical protein
MRKLIQSPHVEGLAATFDPSFDGISAFDCLPGGRLRAMDCRFGHPTRAMISDYVPDDPRKA